MPDAAQNRRTILTYDDYLCLPDDRNRYEILEGELAVTPAPNLNHQDISRNLEFILFSHIKKKSLGKIYDAPVDVILSDNNIVQPDIVFISNESTHMLTKRGVEGAPDLVIEISSPTTQKYDKIIKFQIYARFSVKYYWIIEPEKKVIEEYMLRNEVYNLQNRITDKDVFTPLIFPDLHMDLSEIWE